MLTDACSPICNSAEDCLARGREARYARQWDQAFKFAQQGLQFSPANVGLRLEVVINLRFTGRLAEARAQIEVLLVEHPKHFWVSIEAGHLARRQHRFADALKHFQDAQRIQPQQQRASVGIATALRELQRYDESKIILQHLLDATPEYFDALVEIGHVASHQKLHSEATHYFKRALAIQPLHDTLPISIASQLRQLGQCDEACALLDTFLRKHPNNFGALAESGRVARQQSRFDDAIDFFQRAHSVQPQNTWLPCSIAGCLRECGRLDEASDLLARILANKPNHLDALIERAKVLRRLGRPEEALAVLRVVEAQGSKNDWLPCGIAACLRELLRFDEARAILDKLLKANNDHVHALTELGHMARQQSRFEYALGLFQKALTLNPSNSWLPCGIPACLRQLGRLDESQAALEALLVSNPNYFEALVESGHLANRQRNAEKALGFFRQAQALRPHVRSLSLNIAKALRELGKFEASRTALESVLATQTDYFEALMEVGYLARSERKNEEALKYFECAKSLRPEHAGARAAVAYHLREMCRIEEAIASIGDLPEPYDASVAPLLNQRGHIASFLDDPAQAQHFFQASINADPTFATGYSSLIAEYQRLGFFEDAQRIIDLACETLADSFDFQIKKIRLTHQRGEYEQVETEAASLLARDPINGELWMTLARARIRNGEITKAQDAIDHIPNQLLKDRIWIEECKAHLAWAQFKADVADQHAQEWLRLATDPLHALSFLSKIHTCVGDIASSKKALVAMKKTRELHGSERIRSRAGKGLFDGMLRELRLNPFASRALLAARELPLAEQAAAIGLVLQDEPSYIGSAMALLIALNRLGLIGDAPVDYKTASSRIPRHIIQFWDNDPPTDILELMQTWKTQCHGFTHEVFNELTAESFIASVGLSDVLRAFKTATQPAMKADLFRLAYLYTHGGIYADADDKCRHSIEPWLAKGLDLLLFQEELGSIGNNFIAAAPKHPFILATLNAVTQNILQKQGGGAWWSSGPGIMSITFCNMYLDTLSQSRIPNGVHVISCYQLAKRISIHMPRAYKQSDAYWQSPKSQAVNAFTNNKSLRISKTADGWAVDVSSF